MKNKPMWKNYATEQELTLVNDIEHTIAAMIIIKRRISAKCNVRKWRTEQKSHKQVGRKK
jgi:hypothetical protein